MTEEEILAGKELSIILEAWLENQVDNMVEAGGKFAEYLEQHSGLSDLQAAMLLLAYIVRKQADEIQELRKATNEDD